jgi:hypothetical protein
VVTHHSVPASNTYVSYKHFVNSQDKDASYKPKGDKKGGEKYPLLFIM